MATVNALISAGQLRAAIQEATCEVKAHPLDQQQRFLLFELLCFDGAWERAGKQLDVIGQQSGEFALTIQAYRYNLLAEQARERWRNGGLSPSFLTDPPTYVGHYLTAAERLRAGQTAEVCTLLGQAEDERPALSGKLNGQAFQDFRDADDGLAAVLELFIREQYVWLPFSQLQRLEIDQPRHLRDLLWTRARIETTTGVSGEAFLPTRHADSHEHTNELVKLGRMTDWQQLADGLFRVSGQHLWLADEQETALLEARVVEFEAVTTTG